MSKYILIVLALLISFNLFGKRLKGDSGIINEYSRSDEIDKNRKITDEFRYKTLKTNLERAIKISLQKRYSDFEIRIKDLNDKNIKFEQVKGTYKYYAQYKEYLFLFKYPIDPELYIQRPIEETILIKASKEDEDPEVENITNDANNSKDKKDHSKPEKGFDKFNKEP